MTAEERSIHNSGHGERMPDGLPLDCGGECLGEPCSPCPFSKRERPNRTTNADGTFGPTHVTSEGIELRPFGRERQTGSEAAMLREQEAGIDFEEARKAAEGRVTLWSHPLDDCDLLARAYLALLAKEAEGEA